MTDERMNEAGAGTSASDLSDPAAKTQPAEGGREEVEEGFDPESSGDTASAGWTEQEGASSEGSRP